MEGKVEGCKEPALGIKSDKLNYDRAFPDLRSRMSTFRYLSGGLVFPGATWANQMGGVSTRTTT